MNEAAVPIPFRFHPRVFAALGADLVTSDLVAVIELVKNAYDAFARRVDVRFLNHASGELYLEIQDDGLGMDEQTIRDVWCMVATPFRVKNQTAEIELNGKKKQRRVSGAKGLGRLSVARLGQKLQLFTRQEGETAWKVSVEWEHLAAADSLKDCNAFLSKAKQDEFDNPVGTLLRIDRLRTQWPEDEIDELAEGLSRLKPPFEQLGDFKIFLTDSRRSAKPAQIQPSSFIEEPVYRIKGTFSKAGTLNYEYHYRPYSGKGRSDSGTKQWKNIHADLTSMRVNNPARYVPAEKAPVCGPFQFEIRAWDLDKDSTEVAATKFNLRKAALRAEIRTFKGISVYRDKVLVLPKSENARDWLGLDLRRVSKTGTRISTSQIVGYVGITAEDNPKIVDTSDRERLARSDEVREFESLLQYVIEILENNRDEDRPRDEVIMGDLFKDIDAQAVISDVELLALENGDAADVLPYLEKFNERLHRTKNLIERTFGYYNRLATIGTLAQMLVHEVGNNNVIIGQFLATVRMYLETPGKHRDSLLSQVTSAETALQALERLADRFIPLASRGFARARRNSSFKEALETCRTVREKDLDRADIEWQTELASADELKMDPGELHAILLNLIDNAIYWLAHHDSRKRRLHIETRRSGGERLKCLVMDSGPGIEKGDESRIFLPGVTKRPNGFGMGLTVAAEIIEGHGGKIHVESPGELKGATFVFDLPLADI